MTTVDVKLDKYQLLVLKDAILEAKIKLSMRERSSSVEMKDLETLLGILSTAITTLREAEEKERAALEDRSYYVDGATPGSVGEYVRKMEAERRVVIDDEKSCCSLPASKGGCR